MGNFVVSELEHQNTYLISSMREIEGARSSKPPRKIDENLLKDNIRVYVENVREIAKNAPNNNVKGEIEAMAKKVSKIKIYEWQEWNSALSEHTSLVSRLRNPQ